MVMLRMAIAPTPIKDRLLSGIQICPHSGCWMWQRSVQRNGYGQIGAGSKRGGMKNTHRVAWEVFNGAIPAKMQVLHRCDRKLCCNPGHLFLGTQADNMRDMDAKGRRVVRVLKGVQHYAARLTEDQVRAIRADTRTQVVIAADYGTNQGMVSAIKRRVKWKSVV